MKKSARLCACLLALALLMGMTAFAAEGDDPVLFTFNGTEVYQSEVIRCAAAYGQAQLISSDTAYDEAIEYMIVNQLVPEARAAELGLDQFTDEELAEINAEAADYYEQQLDAYVEGMGANLSDSEKEGFREELRAYWNEMGTTVESAQETHRFNKVKARLLETMDVEISDEEIAQVYEEQVQKDEDFFKDNILAYEYFTEYLNSDVWYVPEGYRGVLQILLYADEALTDAYEEAVSAGEGVEEAAQAIIASKQSTIDAIYARLDAGEDFVSVMLDYTQDPGMDDDRIANGYPVHVKSTVWGKEFSAGAFSEEMQQVGDVSQPIASKYGVHILYYLRDIPGGRIAMDERIRESITTYLTNQKRVDILASWADDYEVTYNQDAIDALMATATEAAE
ncbi:MAG: peptidylprolyl isomerase [Aristaeellaceae bacterium]